MLAVSYFKWIDTPCDKIFLLVLNLLTLTFDLLFKYNKIMNIKAYILHWAEYLSTGNNYCLFDFGHLWNWPLLGGIWVLWTHFGAFFWLIHGVFFYCRWCCIDRVWLPVGRQNVLPLCSNVRDIQYLKYNRPWPSVNLCCCWPFLKKNVNLRPQMHNLIIDELQCI